MNLIDWIKNKWYRITVAFFSCVISFVLLLTGLGVIITPDLLLLIIIALTLLLKR